MRKLVSLMLSLVFLLSFQVAASANTGKEVDLTDGLPKSAFSSNDIWTNPNDNRNFGPEKAFDNIWDENNQGYQTSKGSGLKWIAVDFGKVQSITKLRYKADLAYNFIYGMNNFLVTASNDNQNWIDQYTGKALGNDSIQEFTWESTDSFRYWKIILYDSIGYKDIIGIGEMELIGAQQPSSVTAPLNLVATAGDKLVNLTWSPVSDAKVYNIKRSTIKGGPYISIASSVTGITYTDNAVVNGTTYYYVVTALNDNGESPNSNEASATPQGLTGDRALLTIIMTTGLEKEFDLSITEVNAFLNWYDARDSGTGPAKFAIDKHQNNKGPFSKRTEYVIFDKILTFNVDEYSIK